MSNDNIEGIKKYTVAVARGLISEIPLIGSLTVELLNVTIPNQRQERIEKLLNILASKVFDLTSEELEQRFQSTDFIDIFEDVLLQSVRATSQERLEYLASILEKGLKDEEFDPIQTKRILEILAKLNDIEVVILQSCGLSDLINFNSHNEKQKAFEQKHENIFKNFNSDDSQQKTIFNHYLDNLIFLGLIGPLGLTRNFHSSGRRSLYPTYLGYKLLDLIGIKTEKELIGIPLNPVDVSNDLLEKGKEIENNIRKTKEDAIKQVNTEFKKALDELARQLRRLR